jgi:hypothetical protein
LPESRQNRPHPPDRAGKIVGLQAMRCHQTTFGVGLFTGRKDLQRKTYLDRAIYGDKQVSSQLAAKAGGAKTFGLAWRRPHRTARAGCSGEQINALLIYNT